MRIYGKAINTWTATDERGIERTIQLELPYKDLDKAGNVVAIGTEDFSRDRYNSQTERRFVYAWDGQRRNRGNKRWFMCCEFVEFRKSDKRDLKEYYKAKYQATEIQLR